MITKKNQAQRRLAQRKNGFTLTEIAIVLGIMGLILGAIWVAAASVYGSQRVNTANTAVAQISQNVRTLFSSSSTTGLAGTADMTGTLVIAKAIPSNLINGTSATLVGPFPNGSTMVDSVNGGAGFVVMMNRVPRDACVSLLTALGGTNRDTSLFAATAAADEAAITATGIPATFEPLTVAVTPATAQNTCATPLNKVIFGFGLK